MTSREVFVWTAISAAVVSTVLMTADVSGPDLYDFEIDASVAQSAIAGTPPEHDVARTPGGLLLGVPWLLGDHLTVAAVVNVLSVALAAVAIVKLAQPSRWVVLLLAVGLPATFMFRQAIVHGSTFLPIAAAILWGWVFSDDRPVLAGILWGVAGVARLWPFLLLFAVRDRRVIGGAASSTIGLTVTGLALPGVSIESTLTALTSGGSEWLEATHNGSVAAWLTNLGSLPAVVIGGVLVLGVWAWGIRRLDKGGRIAWTLPAAMLASPLAWVPYLVVVVPALLRRAWVATLAGVVLVLLWPVIPQPLLTTGFGLFAMYAVWISRRVKVVDPEVPEHRQGRPATALR